MIAVQHVVDVEYPTVWIRWVTAQVRIAVSCELTAASRLLLPHLQRLPLTINATGVSDESYLRELISSAAHLIPLDAGDRIDLVTAAVLADSSLSMNEPDLQTLLAWRLAAHHTGMDNRATQHELDNDHECFDPEAIAADLVGSGLIAAGWNRNKSGGAAPSTAARSTSRVVRRTRRPAVSPLQLTFPT